MDLHCNQNHGNMEFWNETDLRGQIIQYLLIFTDEEMEAQRGPVIFLRSPEQEPKAP